MSFNNEGFIGGGQIGYNWLFSDHLIGGFEADFQGIASGKNKGQAFTLAPLTGVFSDGIIYRPDEFFASSLNSSKHTDYLGTVRGRLGGLATPTLLIHGTGGLAYGGVSSSASVTQPTMTALFLLPNSL